MRILILSRSTTATILSLAASSFIVDSADIVTSEKVQNRLTRKRDDILPSSLLDKEKNNKKDVPVIELKVEEEEFLRYLNESLLFASHSMDLTDMPTAKPFPRPSVKPSIKPSTTPSPSLSPAHSSKPTLSLAPSSPCSDLTVNDGEPWYDKDGDDCGWYEETGGINRCDRYGNGWKNFGLVANEACCICGGGLRNPTASPSPTLSSHPTSSPTPGPTYWPTSPPWNRNNYDNEDDDLTITVLGPALVGAFIGLLVIIRICVKNYHPNNNTVRSTNLRTRPTQSTPQQTQHAGSSIVDEREIRREFILTNIIHKKVVTKSSQTNDSAIIQSDEIDEREVIFPPHEAIIKERSERIASMRLSLNYEVDEGGTIIDKKDDICIETLRSIRSGMNLYLDLERSFDESLYSPRSCPICCEDYVKGDDVAWSKNEECCHAFHTDCIVPWLMDHDDCPMCRCVYVKERVVRADC